MHAIGSMGIFVVNLDRSPERWASISEQLEAQGLTPHRVAAVDGKGRSLADFPECDPKGYRLCHGALPRTTEIGCYLSHVKALRAFLESDCAIATIIEDDSVINDDFAEVLQLLEQNRAHWDMMLLYGNHRALPARLIEISEKYAICGLSFIQTGSVAYMINRACAKALLENLLPIRLPYDHAFAHPAFHKLRMRACLPYPVSATRSSGSTIDYSVKQKKQLRWRVPTLAYRTKREIHRVLHYTLVDRIFFSSLRDAVFPGKRATNAENT